MLVRLITLGLALLFAVGVQARELRVALGAQEANLLHSPVEVGKARPQPGGLSGFNEALAREICRRVAARCVISYLTFAEILPGVEAGSSILVLAIICVRLSVKNVSRSVSPFGAHPPVWWPSRKSFRIWRAGYSRR